MDTIITQVVPNQKRATLQSFITANVIAGGELHIDERQSYRGLHTQGLSPHDGEPRRA